MKANFTERRQGSNSQVNFLMKSLFCSVILALLAFTNIKAQYVNLVLTPAITNATVGQNIVVQVRAEFTSADPMDAAQINIGFDKTILQANAVTNISTFTSIIGPTFDNSTGIINFVGADLSAPYPNANFAILSISFTVLAVPGGGITNLVFNKPPTDVASAAVSVLNSTSNAAFNISGVGCTPPTASISATPTCDAKAFKLTLSATPAPTGTAPFDLTITSPSGTATYNNIPVGGTITSFTPPSARLWPAAPASLPPTFDDQPYTIGVKFTTSVTGFVKGVRFLSPDDVPAVPGTYSGQLWTNTGTLLASGTFTGVTADSWQEVLFAEPILISAGTTYVASYNMGTSTKYTNTLNGLFTPVTTGYVTALANGGVRNAGSPVTFPSTATNNNYWADVIFSADRYSFDLIGIKDALECTSAGGTLQTLTVTSADCGTLPVSLINFSATPKDNAILLRWSTASEFNNLGFELQRSIDGNNGWSAIAFVNGAGNSNSTINYSYADENLSASRYYYRLKQIDIDQRFAYSPIVSAELDGKGAFELQQNYPNPYRGETIIRFTLPQKTTVNLSIYDMNGRLVKVLVDGSKDSGTHAVTLHSGVLTNGLYYYKLQAGDFSAVKKMTVQ